MNWILYQSFFRNLKAYDLRNVSMNYFHCTNWIKSTSLKYLWQDKSFFIQGLAKDKNITKKINYSNQILEYSYFKSLEICIKEKGEIVIHPRDLLKVFSFPFPKQVASPRNSPVLPTLTKDNYLLTPKLSCIQPINLPSNIISLFWFLIRSFIKIKRS